MRALFVSPHLIDVILLFTVLEGIILVSLRRLEGRAVVLMLLPGACLMLAIRSVLAGAPWPWLPLALVGALLTHLADVAARWRRR
jgi:hypothetical protein